jgi:hypothetical protein
MSLASRLMNVDEFFIVLVDPRVHTQWATNFCKVSRRKAMVLNGKN